MGDRPAETTVSRATGRAPFDSLREYVGFLESQGHLLRIPEMDQDRFEMTAFAYRLEDRLKARAPSFLVERTRVKGRWHDSPVLGNVLNNFRAVAEVLGVEPVSDHEGEMNKAVVSRLMESLDGEFRWARMAPVEVDRASAPCKEVVLTGEEADLGRFPWIHNNPADGGQFISAGCVVMHDPELGRNVGTHRLQVRGARKLGVCFTSQSHANQFMWRAKQRGEQSVPCSIAIGVDPITWMMSSTRLGDIGDDEYALSGGFRRRPVSIVRSETNALLVPAHAEIIIEGEVSVEKEDEGPYGEMLGYIGEVEPNYWIEVKAITHRRAPIVYNLWPGIGGAYLTWPWQVGQFARLKKICPAVVRFHTPPDVPLVAFICIDKKLPGEGMETGLAALGYRAVGFSKKVVIVLDKDVDPTDVSKVLHAVGTRWQPATATQFIRRALSIPIDPSTGRGFMSSKIIIDATRQLPAEGGPKSWPAENRSALLELAPEAFPAIDARFDQLVGGWRPPGR
jgi:4-hydroxy-3-polyprenylbenzoate decarboxylase